MFERFFSVISAEFGDGLDGPDGVTVELAKIFRRNPILDMLWATDLVHLITIVKALLDAEAQHKTSPGTLDIPVASDLRCVLFVRTG
jgi:hypothetical protein